jgi:hypothetical protein
MRSTVLSLTLVALCLLSACAANEQRAANQTSANTQASTNAPGPPQTDAYRTSPIVPAHGGGTTATAPPTSASPAANEETGMDTAALDAKIEKAEKKAKAKGAAQADKLAAAAAYMERADIFMNAGKPSLYKFALRDYRRTLRYQPDNEQARQSVKTIVDIYKSMNRPVPELGNEP